MKMNKKGFTLIELLAVIVILAVIALIAVPQILSILNRARISAAEDSAYGILKSAETAYTQYLLNHSGDSMGQRDFTCTEVNNVRECSVTIDSEKIPLDFKGTKPTKGTVRVSNKGIASIPETTSGNEKYGLVINGFNCLTDNDGKVNCTDPGNK